MRGLVILLLALSAASVMTTPSRAGIVWHPWCARYYNVSGATICAFDSQAQCLADVRGIGGFCVENVAPPPPGYASRPQRYRPYQ
jgi:hypothetical protein